MLIGRKNADTDLYQFRVFSDEPRRPENRATPDELAIFTRFAADPGLKEFVKNDGEIITMYRPVRLSENQGCLTCHGDPASSPWGNGKDILGYPMENWQDGKLHGVFAISQKIAEVKAAAHQNEAVPPSGWLILGIAAGAAIAILIGARAIRGPIETLNQVAATLSGASQHVSEASGQIASTAHGLSHAASQQAAALEQTSASIEEMSSMVTKNAENAVSTAKTSDESRHKAERGRGVVDEMIHSMGEIDRSNREIMERINQSNTEMTEIVRVIQEIGSKTQVINDIVFKTQLLSFNASVEAARAGAHGQGFAVVAQEVGKLAQMSGGAAQDISTLLEGSVQKVEDIVNRTQSEVEKLVAAGKVRVDEGARVARECGVVLSEIVSDVGQVSQMAGEISTASREQDQGVRELTKAMHQLDQVTQQNAGRSQEAASAATELSEQAGSLDQAVQRLVTTIRGESSRPGAGTPPPSAARPFERTEAPSLKRAA